MVTRTNHFAGWFFKVNLGLDWKKKLTLVRHGPTFLPPIGIDKVTIIFLYIQP